MSKTAQLELPLILPSQAQKHVTVNEALARLDAVAQLRVASSMLAAPPATAVDGTSYLVPAGAEDEWAGMAGQIAVRSNGGWVFIVPRAGWRAWDVSRAAPVAFDGDGWIEDALVVSTHGAATAMRVLEFDHMLVAGASHFAVVTIPGHSQVVGVTGRVLTTITGAGVTGWRIGVAGSDNRYGSGLGTAANSSLVGLSGTPVSYYEDTPLLLSAEGGSFASGSIRLAVHLIELVPPRAI